jgi:hypothetical protein
MASSSSSRFFIVISFSLNSWSLRTPASCAAFASPVPVSLMAARSAAARSGSVLADALCAGRDGPWGSSKMLNWSSASPSVMRSPWTRRARRFFLPLIRISPV